MKIAILSMQEVKNYGSFLQAFSLKSNVEALGHSCDFINIQPGIQFKEYQLGRFHKLKLLFKRLWGWDFITRFKFLKSFHYRFQNEFLPELGVNIGEINKKHYDVIIIGSDEVFNCAQKTWFGFSPQLYGEGLNSDKVITYAASFGATDIAVLEKLGIKNRVAELLKRLAQISVRDQNSFNLIKILTGKTPLKHVDPVFIFDYSKYMPQHVSLKDYMIVYTYPGRISKKEEIEGICNYAKEHHLTLISIGHYFPWCDKTLVLHPFEVLAYFKHATCIVTDTFHGSVFSIKYNKQFCTIVRDMNNNKLSHLLEQFDLRSRICKNPTQIKAILDTPINYSPINHQIEIEIEKAKNYLKSNL